MRIFKSHPFLKLFNAYLIDHSQPTNINYMWNFGSLLGVCLIIQIVTGVTLAMHYNPSVAEAFNSIEHIMRDVNNGWLIRYLHSNTASAFFFIVYLHIGRGMYYGCLLYTSRTITPAIILILIAFPSFKLLYLMDEVNDPSMTITVEGHQWYWSYQYPDFIDSNDEFIEFDSYIVPESDLEEGGLRMLEVDNRVIVPEETHIRFVITSGDVIHSYAAPALGIKCDAYPGRLNQVSTFINREGVFYGQCSEICGILHSSMPIVIESVGLENFLSWLLSA